MTVRVHLLAWSWLELAEEVILLWGERILSYSDYNLRNDNPYTELWLPLCGHDAQFENHNLQLKLLGGRNWVWVTPIPSMRPSTDQALSKCMLDVATELDSGCVHPRSGKVLRTQEWETCLELVSYKRANCIQLHLPFCLFTHIPPLSPLSLTFAAINMGMMVWFCKSLVMLNALISRRPVLLLKPAATSRSPQPSSWTTGASESTGTAEHGWWTFECRVQQGRQRSTFTECRWPASLLQWTHASRIL